MIRIGLFIFAVLLFAVSYYLLMKNEGFLALIKNNPENLKFLRHFGLIYAALGVSGILLAIINHRIPTFIYLFLVFLVASFFGIRLAKKITIDKG